MRQYVVYGGYPYKCCCSLYIKLNKVYFWASWSFIKKKKKATVQIETRTQKDDRISTDIHLILPAANNTCFCGISRGYCLCPLQVNVCCHHSSSCITVGSCSKEQSPLLYLIHTMQKKTFFLKKRKP